MNYPSNLSHVTPQAVCDSQVVDYHVNYPLSHLSHAFCESIIYILLLCLSYSFLYNLYIIFVTNDLNIYILIYYVSQMVSQTVSHFPEIRVTDVTT